MYFSACKKFYKPKTGMGPIARPCIHRTHHVPTHTQKYFLVHTKFYKPEYQNLELKQGIGTTAQGNTHKNNPNNSYWYVRECRAS